MLSHSVISWSHVSFPLPAPFVAHHHPPLVGVELTSLDS